ncbi:interleukin-21 isoform X1 [Siphateles boraxobius]|uniref:interleukin-21 isoform X1 n=2 Tax=Siphateles boraxobius TaxID=180520 RepID=UPI004063FCBA
MKASVCVLFAVACWFVSQADESPMILTLGKVMNELEKIKKGMGKSTTLINSPTTNDLKDCCIASALESFRHSMTRVPVTNAKLVKIQQKITRELGKKIILNGLPSCKPEETKKAQCESSYSEVDSQTFVQNFRTLLQKIYAS